MGNSTASGLVFPCVCMASVSSVTLSAVGEADKAAVVVACGMSTKSTISDRGKQMGGEWRRQLRRRLQCKSHCVLSVNMIPM